MTRQPKCTYEFGPYRIDAARCLLMRDGEAVPLTPKCLEILLALVERGGEVVGKEDLMNRVWPDSFVEEGNLTYNISVLRKALGERADEHQYIVTVPGRGYRFVADVREAQAGPADLTTENKPDSEGLLEKALVAADKATSIWPLSGWFFSTIRRRKTTALIAIALLAVGLIALLSVRSMLRGPVSPERISVAVVDFLNETDDPDLNGLSGMLITSLEQSRRLSVLTRARMFDVLKQMGRGNTDRIDESLGREICGRANVTALVMASIRKFDQLYTIDLKVLDSQKNEYLFTADERGKGKANIPSMIDRLSEKTRAGLKEKTAEIHAASHKVADVTTINLEAYRHYFQGQQLIDKLKFREAEEELKKAVALDPAFALAYYRLAYALAWHGAEEAKEPAREAMQRLERMPEKERYLMEALNASIEQNPDEAIARSQELLKLYPDEKEALWMVGDRSFHKADVATGIMYFEKVLAIDPTFEQALQHIIWAYLYTEQYDKMLEYAKQYFRRIPTSEEAHILLGSAYSLKGDFDQALRTYSGARGLFPTSTEPVARMGDVYIFRNEYEKAEAQFRELLRESRPLTDKRDGYRNLAALYAYRGRFRETLKVCDTIIEIDHTLGDMTDLAHSYGEKALWLAEWNRRDDAKEALERGFELENTADISFYFPVFFSYVLMGEFEKASAIVKNRMGLFDPVGKNLIVSAYRHRANGEYGDALRDFNTLTQQHGNVFTALFVRYGLAECYFEMPQLEKAIETLEKIQRYYNDGYGMYYFGHRAAVYPKTFYLLGKIYEKKGDKESAIDSYRTFLNLWKDADKDLPELLDVRSSLSRLKGASPKHQRG